MRIAILLAGNMRNCFNIPQIEGDHKVNIFISTWDTDPSDFPENIEYKVLEIEKFNPDYFISKYRSNKWIEYPGLSSSTTSGNAVSMWYKIYRGTLLLDFKSYDVIIRYRSDLLCDQKITVEQLDDCVNSKCVYVPEWHGKYETVTCKMMDHFFFGDSESMISLCSYVFKNIDCLLKDYSFPHSAEGFMFKSIEHNNINLKRFKTKYSVKREGKIEEVV